MEPTYRGLDRMHGAEQLTDEDIANDALITAKANSGIYQFGASEASSNTLHQMFSHLSRDTEQFQRRMWEYLHRKGWYSLRWADEREIDEAREKAQSFLHWLGEHRSSGERRHPEAPFEPSMSATRGAAGHIPR